MKRLNETKLALAAAGLVIWGYGIRADQPFPTWLGITLLVVAAAMRFYRPRAPGD